MNCFTGMRYSTFPYTFTSVPNPHKHLLHPSDKDRAIERKAVVDFDIIFYIKYIVVQTQ